MGTRSDFYVAHTPTDLEWLGSMAYDGREVGELGAAENEDAFRQVVSEILRERDHSTSVEQGYPWPWRDSRLTDVVYVWVEPHGVIRRCGDNYPISNIGKDAAYIPDDGVCKAYISLRIEDHLHAEARNYEGEGYHPLWDSDTGFMDATRVDAFYVYPDMNDVRNVRLDHGSGAMFLG